MSKHRRIFVLIWGVLLSFGSSVFSQNQLKKVNSATTPVPIIEKHAVSNDIPNEIDINLPQIREANTLTSTVVAGSANASVRIDLNNVNFGGGFFFTELFLVRSAYKIDTTNISDSNLTVQFNLTSSGSFPEQNLIEEFVFVYSSNPLPTGSNKLHAMDSWNVIGSYTPSNDPENVVLDLGKNIPKGEIFIGVITRSDLNQSLLGTPVQELNIGDAATYQNIAHMSGIGSYTPQVLEFVDIKDGEGNIIEPLPFEADSNTPFKIKAEDPDSLIAENIIISVKSYKDSDGNDIDLSDVDLTVISSNATAAEYEINAKKEGTLVLEAYKGTGKDELTEHTIEINGCSCRECREAFQSSSYSNSGNKPSFELGSGSGYFKAFFPAPENGENVASRDYFEYKPTGKYNEEIVIDNNYVKQVHNDLGLTQIDVIDADSYTVKQYSISNIGPKDGNGYYTVTGPADTEITFSKTVANPNTLNIEEKKGGTVTGNTSFSYNTTSQVWTMGQDTDGDGTSDRFEYETESTSGTDTIKTSFILNADQTVASKIQRTYDVNNNLVEEIVDPDGAALTTSYTYTNGNLTRTDYPDGSWETSTYTANNLQELVTRSSGLFTKYEYDGSDRLVKIIESFNGSAYTTTESDHKVTTYDYTPVYTGDDGSVEPDSVRTTTVSLLGNPVSKSFYGYLANESHVIYGATPTSLFTDPNNLVSSTYTNAEDKVIKTVESGGTGTLITYDVDGTTTTTTTQSGVFNGALDTIVQGTETVEITTDGNTDSTITTDIASVLLISSRTVTTRDSAGREQRVDYHDGTYEIFNYGCCNLDATRSREGIWTSYTYDALGRQITSTTNGIMEITTYDAAGNIEKREQQGTDMSIRTVVENSYDLAGRLEWTKNALNHQTSYSESYNAGQTTSTTTYPDNTTEITVTDSEGRLVSISGTAVFPRGADLDTERVELDASLGYYVHINRSGEADNWVDTFTDALGRVYKSVTINGGTSRQYYENATSRLIKSVSETGAVTLYYEEPANNLSIEALDVNQNDVIDYGTDTITRVETDYYENVSTVIYQRTRTWINPDSLASPGSPDNINEVSNDGLLRINTSITNGITSTIEMQTEISNDGILTTTATRPDGSYTETKYTNGLQDYEKSYDVNDTLLHEVTFAYDIYNRLETQTDSRNGTTTYGYDLTDKVLTLTTSDPDGAGPQTAQTFTNQYNNMGRRDWVENPDTSKIYFDYTTQGLIRRSYGANVYPREYIYDAEGQLEKVKTWKSYDPQTETGTGNNDITWYYNAQGQLEREVDKNGKETTYTYYATSGLLHTRTNARNIVKTYNYDSSGRLETITYSDSTPSISFSYNALGQLDTITDELGARTVKYNTLGQFKGHDWTAGAFNGVETTYNYDGIGRQQSLVRDIGTQQKTVSYDYDDFGRLSKVTRGVYEFTYSYLNNSPNTVEKMTVYKDSAAQMHSKREFDKIMRTTKFSWATGGGN